jgi:GrpB-like predicted nucleotidyltransferase (UPF0157 family)
MTDIRLVEYDPFWPEDFAARRRVIAGLLAPLIADIQHVGSTAVPGLAAKPKIDIDAVLQSEGDIPVALESAATAGYHFHGDPYGNGLWTLTMSGAPLVPASIYAGLTTTRIKRASCFATTCADTRESRDSTNCSNGN